MDNFNTLHKMLINNKRSKSTDKCFKLYNCTHIVDNLYLSGVEAAENLKFLKNLNFGYIINLAPSETEYTHSSVSDIKCLNIFELYDHQSSNISKYFDECIKFIESCLAECKEKKILVHCHAGISRSPTIILAYLMAKKNFKLIEAVRYVTDRRAIYPNPTFLQQLILYEEFLINNNKM